MENAKHTPGPWAAIGLDVTWSILDDEGERVASVLKRTDNAAANCRLITAAPELLAALQEFIGAVDAGTTFADASVVDYARAAIAKAKGE